MLRGQTAMQLAFQCGRHLTWIRAEYFVCTLVPSVTHLEDLFAAALAIGQPGIKLPAHMHTRTKIVADAILPVLEPAQLASLREEVRAYVRARGADMRMHAWARAAELTSCRAGLLLCGDLAVAADVVGREPDGGERVRDLETFWVSTHCTALRRHLGVALA
jgi:hypothetical protein